MKVKYGGLFLKWTNFYERQRCMNCCFLRNKKFTAVYWGAFDPPTIAHEAIIKAINANSKIEELLIIVNNHSYKKYMFSIEKRIFFITKITSCMHAKPIRILYQDDVHPLNYEKLKKIASYQLCAVAGWDSYKNWSLHCSESDRSKYGSIAIVPRGDEAPILMDKQAFLLKIDQVYKDVSSTRTKLIKIIT